MHRAHIPYRRRPFLVPNIPSVPKAPIFYTECFRRCVAYHRRLFLVRRASENASHLVVRSTEKRVAVASERPVHPRVGEGFAGDKFRVNGTKEMVEGAGANKESGVRVRGNLLPVRNFELHKRKRPTFSSTLCFY